MISNRVAQFAAASVLGMTLAGCSSPSYQYEPPPAGDGTLPAALPFELGRAAAGDSPTSGEIADFSRSITGLWRDIDYFRWCTWHSHGLHRSYDPAMPDYAMWWQDTAAIKAGDTITFEHRGGADNIMIRTPKVLTQAISGFMISGDPWMREIVIGYSKGIVALFQGMAWAAEDPPIDSVTARAIFTHNHAYETTDGRQVAVDYDPAKVEKYDWNAHTVPNPDNPHFGSIWIRNMRSKDDVPHLFRVLPVLQRVVQDTDDAEVRDAAQAAVDRLTAFAKDIVDHGYHIRTKEDGETYIPVEDLASFVAYEQLLPNGECTAKLAAALIGYGQPLWNDCGGGISESYEGISTNNHYFNYAIIRYFHLAAITNALVAGHHEVARELLDGLVERVDVMTADSEERLEHFEWDPDMASFLLASAASGLPLTGAEARVVQEQYAAAVEHYQDWPHWDLWDPSVPDGEYSYKPSRDDPEQDRKYVRPEELTYLLQYCYSPWRNAAGAEVVDCDVVLDPTRWGQ